MKTVWVFDDFGKDLAQRDIVMLLASCKLWSIYCPQDYRVLYCTEALGNLLASLGRINLFNEVNPIFQLPEFAVDPEVFWAYPKLRVLSQVNEPVTLVDHDFFIFDNIRNYVDPNLVCYNYTEDAGGYYPSSLDSYVKQLSWQGRLPSQSANVSFLQLPDPEFTKFYAGFSLATMEEFTKLGVPDSRYLIFSEQLMLKYVLGDQDYQCLIKEIFECRSQSWLQIQDSHGIWTKKEADWVKCIHYGPEKRSWSKSSYEYELQFLCEVAGLSNNLLYTTDYLRR